MIAYTGKIDTRLVIAVTLCVFFGCNSTLLPTALPHPGSVSNEEHSPTATDATQTKYESPAHVFNAVSEAAKDRDVAKIIKCHTSETQDSLMTHTLMAAAMMRFVADELAERGDDRYVASKKKVDAILAKHSVDLSHLDEQDIRPDRQNPAVFRDMAAAAADQPAFLAELLSELEAAKGGSTTGFQNELVGRLTDVKLHGEHAEASIVQSNADGTEVRKPIYFKNTERGWRIHMSSE